MGKLSIKCWQLISNLGHITQVVTCLGAKNDLRLACLQSLDYVISVPFQLQYSVSFSVT